MEHKILNLLYSLFHKAFRGLAEGLSPAEIYFWDDYSIQKAGEMMKNIC